MLLIGLVIGLTLSILIGLMLGMILRRITKSVKTGRGLIVYLGMTLPVLCFAYLVVCTAILPGFSDVIDEPLPNGFHLTALKKMPDFARIEMPGDPAFKLTECIDSIQIDGPLIAGHYSHPDGTFESNGHEGYFVLDTLSRMFTDYASLSEMKNHFGQNLNLIQVFDFHSDEAVYLRQSNHEDRVLETFPAVIFGLYILLFLFVMRRSNRWDFSS